jgi:hypothetical protein
MFTFGDEAIVRVEGAYGDGADSGLFMGHVEAHVDLGGLFVGILVEALYGYSADNIFFHKFLGI